MMIMITKELLKERVKLYLLQQVHAKSSILLLYAPVCLRSQTGSVTSTATNTASSTTKPHRFTATTCFF